jgi:hypothetical protein
MTVTHLRHPIPETDPADEAAQLIGWLRLYGVPTDVCDRLDQAVEDLAALVDDEAADKVEELKGEVASLRERIADARIALDGDAEDDWQGPELVEGERSTQGGDHPTINLRAPWGDVIPIDEELTGIIAALWARGIPTAWCCQDDGWRSQGDSHGFAAIGLGGFDADTAETAEDAFRSLVPAAVDWWWRRYPEKDPTIRQVLIPRDKLDHVEQCLAVKREPRR